MPPTKSNIRPKPKAYNDHNVYILGAGFPAEAGLPLVKLFMNRMRDAVAWLEGQPGRDREVTAIERVLDFRLRAAAAAYRVPLDVENVEELFSLASASEGGELADDMALAIAATLDFAQNDHIQNEASRPREYRFYQVGVLDPSSWTKPTNWEPPLPQIEGSLKAGHAKGEWYSCPPYEYYVGIMGGYFNEPTRTRRDTLITFNYDLTAEIALRDLRIPFSYGLSGRSVNFGPGTSSLMLSEEYAPQSAPRVLKLHGSINWAIPGGVGQKLTFYKDYADLREKRLTPVLVPPTWRKYFGGQLSDVWDTAVRSLRTATRIVILGYSIPQTDLHFKYLLATGLQDNISLRKIVFVNPDLAPPDQADPLKARLFGVLGEQHFRRDLIEFVPEKTSNFFHGPKDTTKHQLYRDSIGRPLPAFYTAATSYMTFPPFF
ncbi:MAG: SIR2 family protein [Candidatus Binatales bacterium]